MNHSKPLREDGHTKVGQTPMNTILSAMHILCPVVLFCGTAIATDHDSKLGLLGGKDISPAGT